jgi:Protein of unknown function (DUF3106)
MRAPKTTPTALFATRPVAWVSAVATVLICQVHALAQTAPVATAKPPAPKVAVVTPGDSWKSLDAAQQAALAPLAITWQTLSAGQKNKWLELSKNYAALPAAEQAKLQARMGDWAKLSTQQRAQARHNFAVNQAITSGLTPEQRAAQWQAYQLLSPQEKQALAAQSGKAPVATAANPRPTAPLKNTPAAQFGSANALAAQSKNTVPSASKISIAPHLQKGNSLKSSVSVAGDKSSAGNGSVPETTRQ